MAFITFIIPTLGRRSLKRTLMSLVQQTDPDWKAVVIYDGITLPSVKPSTDDRIEYMAVLPKVEGGAGIVRNHGFSKVDSEWIGFVDDDDYLDNRYVRVTKELQDKADVIQYTYYDVETGNIQPPPNLNHLVESNFGISFVAKTSFINEHNIRFTPGGIEDYRFLKDCLDNGASYLITHLMIYYVGHRSAWSGG